MMKKHPLANELLEAIQRELQWTEKIIVRQQGWESLWEVIRPERFVNVIFQTAGRWLSRRDYSESYLQGARQLLSLLKDFQETHYPIASPDRYQELLRLAEEKLHPHHESQAMILVDRYFKPGSEKRDWFNIEWNQAHGRHSPKDRWEEVGLVVRERLRTAAGWIELVNYLRGHGEEEQTQLLIQKDRAKALALMRLIRALRERDKLTLEPNEASMVGNLSTTFTPPN